MKISVLSMSVEIREHPELRDNRTGHIIICCVAIYCCKLFMTREYEVEIVLNVTQNSKLSLLCKASHTLEKSPRNKYPNTTKPFSPDFGLTTMASTVSINVQRISCTCWP